MFKTVKFIVSEAPKEYWEMAERYGHIYQTKPFIDCLAASGREPIIVGVFKNEDLAGGAAVTIGRRVLNFPLNARTDFGPFVKNRADFINVLTCISEAVKRVSLRYSVTVEPEYADIVAQNRKPNIWQMREIEFLKWNISENLESLRKILPKGKKASLNRARQEGVIIREIITPDDVKEFYRLHAMSMTRGEEVTKSSADYYQNLLNILKPQGMASGFLALHPQTKQAIAAVILLLCKNNTAIYLAVGHDYEYRNMGATDFLVWHCLEFLKEGGYTIFDLVGLPKGDSPRASGIRHFKTAWAGGNGRRCPSYILVKDNFGLNPIFFAAITKPAKRILRLFSSH